MPKFLTLSEAATKKAQAGELMHRIGDEARASEFENMTVEEYAEHKGVRLLQNPCNRRTQMASTKSKAALQGELDEARDYIEELEAKLEDIAGIASDDDDETEDRDDEEAEDEDDD